MSKPRAPKLPDAADREQIETSLDRNVLVEAAAGTGKTTLMVKRILNLVQRGQRLGKIAAITFTEKAAGELKVRLREGIEKEIAKGNLDKEALRELELAQCCTIHSFCAAILHERPVEAGVDPAFQVADAMQAGLLQEEVWQDWIERQMAEADSAEGSLLARALYLDIEPSSLRELAQNVVAERGRLQWENLPPCRATADILREAGPIVERLVRLAPSCGDIERDSMARRIGPLLQLAPEWSALTPCEREHVMLRAVQAPPESGNFNKVGFKKYWPNASQLAGARESMMQLAGLRAEAANAFLREMLSWLRGFGGAYEAEKQRRGRLDFEDLLLKSRDLLRNNFAVRGVFQRRFERLLVDEFQDTDPVQAELVFFLAEKEPKATQWQDVKLAPGKLFVVGDPKQSIYRFRGADIEIYHAAKEAVAKQGDLGSISASFRTVSPLIGWVNEVFERLIQPPEPGKAYQPGYVALAALPELKNETPRVLLLEPTPEEIATLGDKPSVGELRRVEARAVAQLILHLHGNKSRQVTFRDETGALLERESLWSDFAVLLRSYTALDLYEAVFEAHGIPFLVEGGKDYFQRPEVRAVCALLLALDNPADKVELVSVLRSPLFGVSDDDLVTWTRIEERPLDYLAGSGDIPVAEISGRMMGDRNVAPPGYPDGPIATAFRLLRKLHGERNRYSYAAFLERCYVALKIPERFLPRPRGEQRVANLYKLVDTARAVQGIEGMSLRGLARHLRDIAIERAEEGQSPTTEPEKGKDDAVRILTIHKAKGLEWGIVTLADMVREGRGGQDKLLPEPTARHPEARLGGLVSAGFETARDEERKREEAEERRLLYVACTRARDWFVLPWFPKHGEYTRILASAFDPQTVEGVERVDRARIAQPPIRVQPVRVKLGQPEGDDHARVKTLLDERAAWIAERERDEAAWFAGVKKLTPSSLGEREHAREMTEVGALRPLPHSREGIEIGRGVHEALAACDPRDVDGAVKLFPVGEKLIRRALTHELTKRILAADEWHREVPVVWQSPEGLMEGCLDVLFREGDRLVIVDYKTDAQPEPKLYAEQLAAYARAVEAVMGMKVAERLLFFLATGAVEEV